MGIHRNPSIYSGVLFIRDFIINSAPFRDINNFAELEVVSSAENLFRHAQLKSSLDFLIIALGVKDEPSQVDAWVRTLRIHQPKIRIFLVLDIKRSNLPKLLTEYIDGFFDRVTASATIPTLILEELQSAGEVRRY